jgi:hypothetical protein
MSSASGDDFHGMPCLQEDITEISRKRGQGEGFVNILFLSFAANFFEEASVV